MATKVPDMWWKWLVVASVLTAAGGAAFVCLSGSVLQPVLRYFYNGFFADAPFDTLAPEAVAYQTWVYGVLGGVMVGWGAALVPVIYVPFRRGERWAWNTVALSLGLWYVFDTGASAAHGVVPNVLLNTAILVMFVIPLIASRRYFQTGA